MITRIIFSQSRSKHFWKQNTRTTIRNTRVCKKKRVEIYSISGTCEKRQIFLFGNRKIFISLAFERKECFKAFQNEKFCLQMIFLSKNLKKIKWIKWIKNYICFCLISGTCEKRQTFLFGNLKNFISLPFKNERMLQSEKWEW